MNRRPLPSCLLVGTHSPARWTAAGVHPDELRSPLWVRMSRGMYAWACDESVRGDLLRIGGLAPPGGALGGWAAAHLHGATELDGGLQERGRWPVVICASRRQTCRRGGPRVRVWRSDLEDVDVMTVDGVRVTSPVRTGFDLARTSPSSGGAGTCRTDADDALVAVDALLRTGTVTVEEIIAYALAHPRRAGSTQARRVLEDADPRTRSCAETKLRTLWTRDAGLPRPLVNRTVCDRSGRPVAEIDLLDPDAAVAGEYDGAHHASAEQRAHDHVRAERLTAMGLTVIRFAAPDLTVRRRQAISRLRALTAAGRGRDRSHDRWQLQPL